MHIVRAADPARQPRSWMQIIQPTQFAAFATTVDSGAPCDIDGVATGLDAATCAIFASLAEAEAFCRARVDERPGIRFDVFDAAGRSKPPLLTIVHPSRAAMLEGNRRGIMQSNYAAVALLIAAPVLFWIDWALYGGILIMPTFLGINALLIAGRLLHLNNAYTSTERERRERVAQQAEPR